MSESPLSISTSCRHTRNDRSEPMGLFDRKDGHGDIVFEREYRDRITGFSGVCTGISRFVSGCDQVLLAGPAKEGKAGENIWFDDDRLIDVAAETRVKRTSLKGGPHDTPPARPTP